MTSDIQTRMDELKTILLEERDSIGDLTGVPFIVFTYDPNKELKIEDDHIKVLLEKLEFEDLDVAEIDMRDLFFSLLEEKGILDSVIDVEKREPEELASGLNTSFFEEHGEGRGDLIDGFLERIDYSDDVVVVYRTGILYPFTSISVIFRKLENVIDTPVVVFYPAENEEGVRFLDETEGSYYRSKVI